MSTIDNKEIKENLGFGLIFATVMAAVDYLNSGKKPTIMSFSKNGAIAAGTDIIYDYGKKNEWWPLIK